MYNNQMTRIADLEKKRSSSQRKLTSDTNRIRQYLLNLSLHVGEYKWTSRSSDFNGWLLCDGRSLSRADYDVLFGIIQTSFGSDDSTTFKIPDYRGRVLAAIGEGEDLSARVLGDRVGTETHTLTGDELPGHVHTGTTDSDGSHTHTASSGSSGAHTHTHNANGGAASTGLAFSDGTNTLTESDSSGGELNLVSTAALAIDSAGAHTHTVTVDSSGTHTHDFTTASTGEGEAHNNMQPTVFGGSLFIFAGYVHW